MIEYLFAESLGDYQSAAVLFKEYAREINIDLSFQHFQHELSHIQDIYSAPTGGIILCRQEGDFVGCAAIRKFSEKIAELKRMYVKPSFQHSGIGKVMLEKALGLAIKCKYQYIRLDTLSQMKAAIHLYRQYGFYEISPYYNNPDKSAFYFEKKLHSE